MLLVQRAPGVSGSTQSMTGPYEAAKAILEILCLLLLLAWRMVKRVTPLRVHTKKQIPVWQMVYSMQHDYMQQTQRVR
jgi:hypothetical protein